MVTMMVLEVDREEKLREIANSKIIQDLLTSV